MKSNRGELTAAGSNRGRMAGEPKTTGSQAGETDFIVHGRRSWIEWWQERFKGRRRR